MIGYELPASVSIGGRDFAIRTDYRAILDIILALNDPELTDEDRAAVALGIFYPEETPEDLTAALDRCMWFISGGDIRAEKMHWWTFLGLYYEIGDCTFAQIVKIRNAKATGKKLDKADREWARKNAELITIETHLTQAEEDTLAAWTKGGGNSAGE